MRYSSTMVALALLLSCVPKPMPGHSVAYQGEAVYIRPIPEYDPHATWIANTFARGDSVLEGYVIVTDSVRVGLADFPGIDIREHGSKWTRVVVDWEGLAVLSHVGVRIYAIPRDIGKGYWAIHGSVLSHRSDGPGHVVSRVRITIDARGNVAAASLAAGSGDRIYDEACLETAVRQEFPPAIADGRPAPCEAVLEFVTFYQ